MSLLSRFRARRPRAFGSWDTAVRNGMVEVLERREVSGWVEVGPGTPPVRVSLWINDVEAQSTWAIPNPKRRSDAEIRMFRMGLTDVWRFTRLNDRVSLRAEGVPLPIVTRGMFYLVRRPGNEPISRLHDLLDKGHLFNQGGRLRLSKTLDTDWQARVIGLYDRVSAVLESELGYQAFLCYGSLLGAVRNQGVIGHDLDFDAAYVSSCTDGPSAVAESKRLAFALIEAGFDVVAKRTCLAITDAASAPDKIDLFHLFVNSSGYMVFPFGAAGTGRLRAKEMGGGLQRVPFATGSALIPENAERVVEHIYGKDWRIPNPGFHWLKDRTPQKPQGIVPLEQVEEVYWANFYARHSYTRGSTFCEFVLARDDLPRTIADIGCGDGRDAVAFARAGRVVLGVDRSHIAVKHANSKRDDLAPEGHLELAACDISDSERLTSLIAGLRDRSPDGRVLFYMRFFLHSIVEDAQADLLAWVRNVSHDGDAIAVEFRTDKDAEAAHEHVNHFRRYQNGKAFGEALRERYGFEVVVELEGNGLSPYKGEDPHLYRAIAVRNDGTKAR